MRSIFFALVLSLFFSAPQAQAGFFLFPDPPAGMPQTERTKLFLSMMTFWAGFPTALFGAGLGEDQRALSSGLLATGAAMTIGGIAWRSSILHDYTQSKVRLGSQGAADTRLGLGAYSSSRNERPKPALVFSADL